MESEQSFGKRLKKLRLARGFTQEELGAAAHCTVYHIRHIERGQRRPSQALAEALAQALDIPSFQRDAFIRDARGDDDGSAPRFAGAVDGKRNQRGEEPAVPFGPGLAWLEAGLAQAVAGRSQICLVAGEAGYGKTTLVRQLATAAQEQFPDIVIAAGHCTDYLGAGEPYLPIREAFTQLVTGGGLGVVEGQGLVEQRRRLQRAHPRIVNTILSHAPDLIDVLVTAADLKQRLRWDSSLHDQLAGDISAFSDQIRQRAHLSQPLIFQQLVNCLQRITQQFPLLLVLENLHWIDASSVALLTHVVRRLHDQRIMIVCTYRGNELHALRDGSRHPLSKFINELERDQGRRTLDLGQVAEGERRAFVDRLLDQQPNTFDTAFRDQLFRHTGGIPLFTVELLDGLKRRSEVRRDSGGRWEVSPTVDWSQLPPRVDAVISERLEQLSAEERDILSVAAVVGEQFSAEIVARVENADELRVMRILSRSLSNQHQLVAEVELAHVGGNPQTRFRFVHRLFKNHLYQLLSPGERRILHRAVAQTYEALYGVEADTAAATLAHHYQLGGDLQATARYLQLAGNKARRRLAFVEAVRFYTLALALPQAHDSERHFQLLLARQNSYDVLARRDEQQADLNAAEALLPALTAAHRIELNVAWARFYGAVGRYDDAIKLAQASAAEARRHGDRRTEAESMLLLGLALSSRAQFEAAMDAVKMGIELAQSVDYTALVAEGYHELGRTALILGKTSSVREYLTQALELTRSRRRRAWIRLEFGRLARLLGEYSTAAADYRIARDLFTEIGDRAGESEALQVLGNLAWSRGDYTQADTAYQGRLAIAHEMRDPFAAGIALHGLQRSARAQRQFDLCLRYIDEAVTVFPAVNYPQAQAAIALNRGEVAMELGQWESARQQFQTALTVSREHGLARLENIAVANLAHIGLSLSTQPTAVLQRLVHSNAAQSDHARYHRLQARALTQVGELQALEGDTTAAIESLSRAAALHERLGHPGLLHEALGIRARVQFDAGLTEAGHRDAQRVADFVQQGGSFKGSYFDCRNLLECFTILRTAGDADDAAHLLHKAYSVITSAAAALSSPADREAYLHNVPWHRAILEAHDE